MGSKGPGAGAVATAILFALSCFGLTLFVWKSFGGNVPFEAKGYEIHAHFLQAPNLATNADVRVAGVTVGKVVAVTPTQGRTDAVLRIDRQYVPIYRNAHAILRSKTLLGETFVELTLGTKNAGPVADGGTLSNKNIKATQQVDQVLGSFDAPTRKALQLFLMQTSIALHGVGPELNSALGEAGPAALDLRKVLVVLDSQRADIRRLINNTGTVLAAVSARSDALQDVIRQGDAVFATTAARDRALTATIRALPPFLASTRVALRRVDQVLALARPTLAILRPVAPLLRPGLVAAAQLAPDLKATFSALGPVETAATTALPALRNILHAARPALRVLYPTGRELVPVAHILADYRHEGLQAMAFAGAATEATLPGAGGRRIHYLRTVIPVNNEAPVGQPHREPTNRYNPYFAPLDVGNLKTGLHALDCANTANKLLIPPIGPGAAPPPCRVQKPWNFRGARRSYPHVTMDPP